MKKKIILVLLTFLFVPNVKAQCDNTRINELKSLAKNIEITYELDPNKTEKELREYDTNNITGGVVRVIIAGLTENFLIIDDETEKSYNYYKTEDGVLILTDITKGTKKYNVYSIECEKKIKTLSIRIPTFNKFSLDPLCQNIDNDALSVCDTWYEGNLDYESFKERIDRYNEVQEERRNQTVEVNLLDKIIDFLKNSYLYIAIGIIIIVIVIIAIKVKRKRSELE